MRGTTLLRALLVVLLCGFTGLPSAIAQEGSGLATELADRDDRGFLTGLLEDSLGGDGRIVRIEGFSGALSSTATIARITVADEAGVWLSLETLQMDWNRSALLRGRIDIDRISAETISLERAPIAPESDMPAPEAGGFSLPNLPVSIEIAELRAERIILAEPILGAEAELQLDAQAQLADGSGSVVLSASRIDGQAGEFSVTASYAAQTGAIEIDLDLSEEAGGIAARSLNLPGQPSVALRVSGEGSLDDLVTEIALDTDGTRRVEGQVVLLGNAQGDRSFEADLSGDLTPLVPPEYAQFFGPQSELSVAGSRSAEGQLELPRLVLSTQMAELTGRLALDETSWPTLIALDGVISDAENGSVALPVGDGDVVIDRADLRVRFDASVSNEVTVSANVVSLGTPTVQAETLRVQAEGDLADALNAQTALLIRTDLEAAGLRFEDAEIQRAVGARIAGRFTVNYSADDALRFDAITLDGESFNATGDVSVSGLSEALETAFDVAVRADDLARFGGLAGLDLSGQARVDVSGTADLGGAFDIALTGQTDGLSVGIAQADAALAGRSQIALSAVRDETGTRLPNVSVQNDQFRATAQANLKADASQARFDLDLADSSKIDPNLKGPVRVTGAAQQDALGWQVDVNTTGPFGAVATVEGRVTGATPNVAFDVQLPDVNAVVPNFRGAARVTGTALQDAQGWRVDTSVAAPYGISGTVAGVVAGAAPKVDFDLNVPNVGALGAGINGPLSVAGSAEQRGEAWQLVTSLSGLSGADADVSGLVRTNGTLDLQATGSVPLGLANPFLAPRSVQGLAQFDLALRGPAGLSALSGTVTTQGASFSAPNLRTSLRDIAANISLGQNRAVLDVVARVADGGQIAVRGPVTLTGSMPADLALQLSDVRLVDPTLFKTIVNGQVSVRGPLAGGAVIAGQIDVGETDIQVPNAQSTGFAIIPEIAHVGASGQVRQTLSRAGLDAQSQKEAAATDGPSYALDVVIRAPSRIFVRGRGLDAELGGSLTLGGTTTNLISAGQFSLIRGRLDILGKRFALDEGRVLLQGRLDPFLRFVATTTTTAGTASVVIEGPASEPRVQFISSPEAPEDEVLAQIFFGRDTSQLSAFQALQLASAVATLAGRGGEGVVSKLRRGFGFDDLDVTSDAEGNTGLRVGKYISDNIYTDVTIGDTNQAGVSVNIDLTPNLTARGQVKQDGDSSLGIFYEKDY